MEARMVNIHFYKSLSHLCFSDFDIFKICIDEVNKIFQIDLEGVWLIQKGNEPKELGSGYVKIYNFKEIKAKFFNSVKKTEGKANVKQIKQLKEINDHEVESNYLKIFGFIDDGSWLECEIIGGEVKAEFEE
jgi:hypothetical protein